MYNYLNIKNQFLYVVREKVDTLTERLDVLMTERSATLTTNEGPLLASSGSAAILSTSELPTTTPLRKIKSCELFFVVSFLWLHYLQSIHLIELITLVVYLNNKIAQPTQTSMRAHKQV